MPETTLTAQQIADAVTDGVLEAFREIGRALSLTDGERNVLEIHRANQQVARENARQIVRDATNGHRQTYNVTR